MTMQLCKYNYLMFFMNAASTDELGTIWPWKCSSSWKYIIQANFTNHRWPSWRRPPMMAETLKRVEIISCVIMKFAWVMGTIWFDCVSHVTMIYYRLESDNIINLQFTPYSIINLQSKLTIRPATIYYPFYYYLLPYLYLTHLYYFTILKLFYYIFTHNIMYNTCTC